jgi:hypothetical protein
MHKKAHKRMGGSLPSPILIGLSRVLQTQKILVRSPTPIPGFVGAEALKYLFLANPGWPSNGLLRPPERGPRRPSFLKCALLLRLGFASKVTLLSHEKGGSAMSRILESGSWTSIAEQASKEMDSAKLMILVEELCYALDGERKQKSQLATISKENEPRYLSGD